MMSASVPALASTTSLAIPSNDDELPPTYSMVSQGYFAWMALFAESYAPHCGLAEFWILVLSFTGGWFFVSTCPPDCAPPAPHAARKATPAALLIAPIAVVACRRVSPLASNQEPAVIRYRSSSALW